MKGWEVFQGILDLVGVLKDKAQDSQLSDLRKNIEGLESGGGNAVPDPDVITAEISRQKNQLLDSLALATDPIVKKRIERRLDELDDEAPRRIAAAEARARKAAEAKEQKKAKDEEREKEEALWRNIKRVALIGILGSLFLVVFTPVRFIDIFGGLALFAVGYGIYHWRWKK